MYLNEIPGYSRAIARADRLEDYWRDRAFLDLTETLRFGSSPIPNSEFRNPHSLEVHQLTLRMFLQLCAVRAPFLVGGSICPEHVAQILWRLVPEYDARNKTARSAFIEKIALIPFRPAVRAIGRYLDRMLIDRPPSRGGGDGRKADTSFAASLVHLLANAYGWNDDQILDTPMPRLFQYIRRIQRESAAATGESMPSFNPLRDRLAKRFTDRALQAAILFPNANAYPQN